MIVPLEHYSIPFPGYRPLLAFDRSATLPPTASRWVTNSQFFSVPSHVAADDNRFRGSRSMENSAEVVKQWTEDHLVLRRSSYG